VFDHLEDVHLSPDRLVGFIKQPDSLYQFVSHGLVKNCFHDNRNWSVWLENLQADSISLRKQMLAYWLEITNKSAGKKPEWVRPENSALFWRSIR
jgi:hypothetical protein